jgi:hypothetical protein
MEQSPSSEADNSSASQEIPHLAWDQGILSLLPLDAKLNQLNQVYILTPYSFKIILILPSYLQGLFNLPRLNKKFHLAVLDFMHILQVFW